MAMGAGDIDGFFASIEKSFQNKNKSATDNVPPSGLDEALREVERQFKQKKDNNSSPPLTDNTAPKNQGNNDLFSDIERRFKEKNKSPSNPSDRKNISGDLFSDIERQFKEKNKPKPQLNNTGDTPSLFADITRQFEEKRKTESNKNTWQDVEEIRRQEAERRRKEKQIVQKAEEFLKNLDPYSDEGFWFEQFAQSYPSRLQAAIEYLQALEGGK